MSKKPKVLIVTQNLPYPLIHGGAIAQYYFIEGLRNKVDFVLCTQVNTRVEKEGLNVLRGKIPELQVFYVNNVENTVPGWKKKLKNTLFFVKSFTKKNKVIPVGDKDDFDNIHYTRVDNQFDERFVGLVNSVIRKEKIKYVQFEFYETLDLCFSVPEDVFKIFIHHEVRFKRLRLAYEKSPKSSDYKNYIVLKNENYEKLCLKQMHHVAVFNTNDAGLISDVCRKITVSPFGIPDELIFRSEADQLFSRFLFVGGESHAPNMLGLSWFLDEIYIPANVKVKYPIYITGKWSENFRKKYAHHKNIVFCGLVDSIEPFFENSIFVNPILTGAGIRTKVLHAFVNKVPVMSTRFGAEGCFSDTEMEHLFLFDTMEEFLEHVNNFSVKEIQGKADSGYLYYKRYFNKEDLLSRRLQIYESI